MKAFAEDHKSLLSVPSFADEMDRRIEELEKGKVKGRTWEEVKQRAMASINKIK